MFNSNKSTKVKAHIALHTDTALIPMQGSCLPEILICIFSKSLLIVCWAIPIELVGLIAIFKIISSPVVIPPKIPLLLFVLKISFVY